MSDVRRRPFMDARRAGRMPERAAFNGFQFFERLQADVGPSKSSKASTIIFPDEGRISRPAVISALYRRGDGGF